MLLGCFFVFDFFGVFGRDRRYFYVRFVVVVFFLEIFWKCSSCRGYFGFSKDLEKVIIIYRLSEICLG